MTPSQDDDRPEGHGQDGHATDHGQDGRATLSIRQGAYLPHWTLEGAIYAVTFRLADSLPRVVVEQWEAEIEGQHSAAILTGRAMSAEDEERLEHLKRQRAERYLDEGHGASWMSDGAIAQIVAGALAHFDGVRYDLLDWCVMPNHVHAILKPLQGYSLPVILHSWKSYSAIQANRSLGRKGRFWQEEYYDHLVRDQADLDRCVAYVLRNPERVGLLAWPWVGTSAPR